MHRSNLGNALVFSIFVLLFICTTAAASVFGLYSDDAQAAALGGAFIARSSGATGVFYNPAALIQPSSLSIAGRFQTQTNDYSFAEQSNVASSLNSFSGSIAYSPVDWLAVGGGFFSFIGDSNSFDALDGLPIINIDSEFNVTLLRGAASIKVSDNFFVGFSIDYYDAELYSNSTFKVGSPYSYSVGTTPSPATQSFSITGDGLGFSAGVLARLNENFTFGATFRGETELEFDGTVAYPSPWGNGGGVIWSDPDGDFDPSAAYTGMLPASLDATATFTIPADLGLGVLFDVSEDLSASLDVHWVQWSGSAGSAIATDAIDIPLAGDWDDTLSLHLGAKYRLTELLSLLGGFSNNPSPITEDTATVLFPYGDQRDFSVGIAFESTTYKSTSSKDTPTGKYGAYATVVFSQLDDIDSTSTEFLAPPLSSPFTDFPLAPGTSTNISGDKFTFLIGFKLDFN